MGVGAQPPYETYVLKFGPAPELGEVGFTTLSAPIALDTAVKFVTAAHSTGGQPWG